ncbi:hypothetical protein J1N35_034756 [Gossypium stocksii]|uniref:Uncharacterized protein n=1 Tax=Gossypium stocksii TaxID=47602 RepID=A0A9D3ZPI3_9ROSI|nr:hypothetical protein J1N35_034756 [Gossypium stocksii]
MLEGKAVIEDTDMPLKMQAGALASASRALDLFEVVSSPISKELSSILLWELSTFSSSTQTILFLVDGSSSSSSKVIFVFLMII